MKTTTDLARAKQAGRPISMVTCYDYTSARMVAASEVDCILVGDSAAMVMHGHATTIPADLEMLEMHVSAVARGAPETFIVGDMPFLTHRKGVREAVCAVQRLMRAGAQAVKLEGARGNLEIITHIVESGVPVMGHLGLTPQSIHQLGGNKVQGRSPEQAERLALEARQLQEAGCFALVLELVPTEVASAITRGLDIPTIGIGAGPHTDGQVLVWHDMLGMNPDFTPKFLRTYLDGYGQMVDALNAYNRDVKQGSFPSDEESFAA